MTRVYNKLESMIHKIKSRYDVEHDTRPVIWTDMDLYEAVLELAAEVDSLNRRIAELEQRANK